MHSRSEGSRETVLDAGALTVTLFGNNDDLDTALRNELGQRGCRTHSVSVRSGWLATTTHAIVRAETEAGSSALHGLAEGTQPLAHVVVICEAPLPTRETAQVEDLCRTCGLRHDTELLWHRNVDDPLAGSGNSAERLASTVADALESHAARDTVPSFVTHLVSN